MSEQENISHDTQEEVQKPKPEKAKKFRATFGYSLTM